MNYKRNLNAKRLPIRIDLTAMVDLGFLLITFFMVGTAMSKPKPIEVNMPVRPTEYTSFGWRVSILK